MTKAARVAGMVKKGRVPLVKGRVPLSYRSGVLMPRGREQTAKICKNITYLTLGDTSFFNHFDEMVKKGGVPLGLRIKKRRIPLSCR